MKFSLLVKPASADCNLRCQYCFYLPKSKLYDSTPSHRMSREVLERLIKSYLETDQSVYEFGWQGGEPTLMGVDFFRSVTELQMTHGRAGMRVGNALQTNGTLITSELAKHLAQYKFLVGISLDGPASEHDYYRKDISGKPTYDRVLNGIEQLRTNNIEFNVLTLVNSHNAKSAKKIYSELRSQSVQYQQYIPCVEFDNQGTPYPFAISSEAWGDFLCELFDLWYTRDTRKVSIRLFDSIVNYLLSGERNVCTMRKDCQSYFVIEHNGDIYPCDFYVDTQYRLGNIMENSWDEIIQSAGRQTFKSLKSEWDCACNDCEFIDLCMGDCLKHRMRGGLNHTTRSYLCKGWENFYAYTLPRFKQLVSDLQMNQISAQPISTPKRNDPCPCGSGKKAKKCCYGQL